MGVGSGIWGWLKQGAGPTGKQTSDLDSMYSSGGSDSFSGLDPKAQSQWDTLFTGLQQGIAPWQQAGFDQAVKQAGSNFSALNAARGGNNPFTGNQIASSAAQYVAPQFATLNSQLLNNLMQQRQISTGKTRGPGLNYNDVNSSNQNWWSMWNNIGSSWGGGAAQKGMSQANKSNNSFF